MKKLIIIFWGINNIFCFAQTNTPQIPASDSAFKNISVATKPVIHPISVTKFYIKTTDSCFLNNWLFTKDKYFPDDYISVKIDSNGFKLAASNKDTFRLWIDGICFDKIKPLFINHESSSLIFKLNFDTAQSSPWQLYYAYPNYWNFYHQVSIRLGTRKVEFRNSEKVNIKLFTSAYWMVISGYSIFVILLYLILKNGNGIIRDTGLYLQNGVKITGKKNELTNEEKGIINIKELPYSLARFQFLFWLLIIFFSIIHIWAITDSLTTPTGTVLLLLGISGGTFYIGSLMDSSPADNTTKTATECVSEFVNKNSKTKGFMLDVLNDGKGISLHRLQLVMFTIFLGFYFLWQVLYGLALPQFTDTLMLLMGISSGTYAGIKTIEK